MGDLIDEIRSNPLVLAVGAVVLIIFIFLVRNSMKNSATTTTALPLGTTNAASTVDANGNPIQPAVYTNSYTSYPIVQTLPGVPGPQGIQGPQGVQGIPGLAAPTLPPGIPIPKPVAPLPRPVTVPPVIQPVHDKPVPVPVPTHTAPTPRPIPAKKYVTVTKWPSQLGTLSGIAAANGISLSRVELLNPTITNPNLIYPGQQVRVA